MRVCFFQFWVIPQGGATLQKTFAINHLALIAAS